MYNTHTVHSVIATKVCVTLKYIQPKITLPTCRDLYRAIIPTGQKQNRMEMIDNHR